MCCLTVLEAEVQNHDVGRGVPTVALWVKNRTSIHEDVGLNAGLAQWVKDLAVP